MLTVKTRLGISKIHGIGLFADQDIDAFTVVWSYNPRLDLIFTIEQLNSLSGVAKTQVLNYAYETKAEVFVLCGDDARFFNHSNEPNCLELDSADGLADTLAHRKILRGDEMTINYNTFDYSRMGFCW